MIEPDINERMARFAPSQNMGDPGDDAIKRAVASMAKVPARPQVEQDDAIHSAVLQMASERKQDMAASLMAASQVNPDQAARASRLGEQFGVGQDIALRNMQELERESAVRDIQRRDLMRNDPVLARYLSDRAFASEAQDDVGMLAMVQPLFMEAAMIQARGAPALFDAVSRGYQRGKKQMELGEMQALQMVQYPTPQERDDMANLTKEIQELGRGGAIGTGAEMIGQYAANLKEIAAYSTAGAAIGSVVPGAGTAAGGALGLAAGLLKTTGTTAAGKLYNTLYEKGVPDDVAIPAAIAGGFFSGLVEVVGGKIAAMPVQSLAKRVMAETLSEALARPTLQQAAKEFVKAYGLQVGGETFEEGTQAISDMLSEEIALAASGIDSELTLRQGFMNVIESALYGAAGSSILGGIGPGANLLVDLRRASNSERQQKFFEGLTANNKDSRLAQRSPVGYERFLAAQADGTNAETIYVDGRIAQQVLAQSGVPVAQLEEIIPGIRERIAEAVETGGDVTIPTASFGAKLANTKLGNALLPHMRLSPDAMSATEAQEFATQRQEVVREAEQILAQKQETDATFVQQARQIEDTLTSQIVATGQMDERAARSSAQFMRDFYVTQAAALGISPQELYERFPVRVQGEQAAQTVAPGQVAPQTQASATLTETETKPLQTSLGELSARTEEHNARMANEGREESHPQAKAGRALKDSVRRLNDAINANDETEIAHQAWRLRNRLETLRQNLDANAIAAVEAMLAKLDAFMQQRGIEIHDPIGEKYVAGWMEVEVVSWEEVTEKNPEPDTIKQTIRPIIRRNGQVASRGQVIATYATEADLKRHEEKQAQREAELLARAESRQVSAPLDQPAPVLEQAAQDVAGANTPGVGVANENKLGFWPALRVRIQPDATLPDKPLILTGTTNKNATKQLANIDDILGRFPNAAESPEAWAQMLAYAFGTDDVPVPPYAFIRDTNGDGSFERLSTLTDGQIADATHGFDNAREFRRAYTSGELDVITTGKLFLWSFLSRGVSPYTQESLFIDAFDGADVWIKKAAQGKFTEADFDKYEKWAKSVAPQGSGQPGAGATHNLNAFGKNFLMKMGAIGPDGKSNLQRLHDMMCDPNQTGKQIRREFATFGEGVGIDNKVVSFTLLVAGFNDVMVLDRVQVRQLWDDGRFSDTNLYDGVNGADGKKIAGSSLNAITEGVRGIMIYEAIERQLNSKINEMYTRLGRPQDGSIGRYHWETWVAYSQQEAAHATLDAILLDAKGDDQAISKVSGKQGEYGAYEYGTQYNRDQSGTPWFRYVTPLGGTYDFSVPAFRQFLTEIKKPANKVVPTKFKVTESGNAPWYTRPEVNQQQLEEQAAKYADRGGGTGEGTRLVREAAENADAIRARSGPGVQSAGRSGLLEQAAASPAFYSALEREVTAIDSKALTAAGWGERLTGLVNKGAIKADELEWSGLSDYLKMQEGKVSKDTVLEFLRGNGVKVEIIIGGDARNELDVAEQRGINRAESVLREYGMWTEDMAKVFAEYRAMMPFRDGNYDLDKRQELFIKIDDALNQANGTGIDYYIESEYDQVSSDTVRYEQYTLPGGTNYREVLLTLPAKDRLPIGYSLVQQDGKWRIADSSGNLVIPNLLYGTTKEIATRNAIAYLKSGQLAPVFQSSHWSQLNVLVHLRMNDRVDADGKRVLFVEEVQSDWGQAGVKRGFVNQRAADEAELADLSTQQEANPTDARKKQIARIQERLTKDEYNISRAPYVETTDGWLNLGLKQIMLEAVRGGYDRVAFVNGQQSAERYDLSKQVSEVAYNRDRQTLLAYDKNGDAVFVQANVPEQNIADYIGKEVAQRLLTAPEQASNAGTMQRLKGEDLKIGGEGMQNFYNKIVPTAMGKLLKKYGGGKLNDIVLPNMRQQEMEADAERMGMNVADVLDLAEDTEYAEAQPGFDITPELVKKLESGLPLFQAMPAAGPARGGFDPSRLTTILNKTADLSTFLHESAHAFLTFYEQMSQAPNAPARIVNDMDELLRWFGIAGATPAERIANWNGMSLDQKRKYHETFAYNFEVYLFEGKAPSAEMQGMFERFGAWLKRVYKSIRDDLNAIYRREFGEDLPILTGEVRQVMDRMLATDEQIKRQAAINEMKPQFQTQEQSGMDDAEWAAYQAMQQEAIEASVTDMNKASMRQLQWLGNARSRILRDMQRKHEAKRKEVAAEVAAAVRVEPLYRAMTYLRTGKFIDTDGAEVVVEGPHRLDIKRVQAIYAGLPSEKDMEAVRATGQAMPKMFAPDIAKLGTGKFGMMGVDGLDPDVVAESFGYSSGDQMIRALLEAKPIKEAVAERTDAEMLRRYGDMNTPEAQEAEVQKALHNEARARFVAVELRHIARATQPVRVMLEAAKQVARELIAGMTLRDVRPGDFIAAEARAARDASRMGATVNPEAVGRAAYTRTYNERIAAGADEATAVAEATTAATEAARKAQERSDALKAQYGADPQQALIRAKRAQLYQNQLAAQALVVREEVAKQVKYLRRIMRDTNVKAMGAQAADQIAALLERFEVAPVSLKRLDERKALAAWLAEQEAAGLVPDIAPEVADEARRVNYQQLTVTEFRNLVDAIRQIEFIGKNERKVQLAAERAAFEEKRDEIVTRIRAVGRLRGVKFDPRSPLTNIGRSAAALRGFAAQHLKAASVARILDGGEDDGPLWQFAIRSANAAADMETRMRAEASAKIAEILAPVFKLGNMGGKGVFFPSIKRSLNREARIAIAMNVGNDGNRQRLLDGEGWTMEQIQPILESLTEAEWNAVQQVWDYIDTYRPLIAEKERRLYGKEPQWVTPVPMSVRTADGKTVNLTGGYYPIKYDPIASDRVATVDEAAEAKRALDGAYTAATTRRSFTKQRAKEVVGRPLLYTLDAAFGGINDVIHDLSWHEWLIQTQRLLRDPEFANAVRETRGPEFLKQLRDWAKDNAAGERKIGVAGEAALSWLRQGISASGLGFNVVSAAMQVTGFNQSIVRLGAKYVGRGVAQFAASPIDTARMVADKSSFMAERGRTQFREINEIRNRVRGQTEVARRVTAGTYFLMMNMQRTVDIPTWLAGYQKALDAGKDDATAVALADQAVRDTQGSGLISDLAAIERGGPMMKLFTVFYSYMNTVYNMTAVQTMTARGKGKLAADYAMLLVVPVVLGQAIKNLIQPDAGDDELDPEALARKLAAEELSFLMGTMVIAREFGGAAQLLTGAEGVRMGYGGPAGLRAVGEVYGLAAQAGQLDFDRAFRRSAINTLGAFTGLPSAQVNRTIDGIEAVIEGEVGGVGAVVAPLTGVQR